MQINRINEEVFFANEPIVKVNQSCIYYLLEMMKLNKRKRIRLCAHEDIDNKIHEMIIILSKDTYIRPHKHLNKSESFHVIEGLVDVVIFDETGNIIEVVKMGDYSSGNNFFYRLSNPYYHTPLIRSDFILFHETVNGPFNRSDNIEAPWSPDAISIPAQNDYLKMLTQAVDNFANSPKGTSI
jgi:cupin fold WbuC family metalloprotein